MANDYESGAQKVIPAVLLYAFHQSKVLMLHRPSSANDFHSGKWNGLGGKLEVGEVPAATAVREFLEESTGKTTLDQWRWAGQLFFPNFKAHKKEDWWVTVFTIELSDAQAQSIPTNQFVSPEGTLHWIPRDEILNLNLWDGDRHFIPHVLMGEKFEGVFHYENGSCVRHRLSLL